MKTLSIEERENLSPFKALEILLKGNERFINNLSSNKNHLKVLSEFSSQQKPFAFILSCIDSRAPVEIIFDQGIGDLFSARVAGNIVNEDMIASAEFAVKFVGVKLLMVLGHTNCGAMTACLNHIKDGHLSHLVAKIEPAFEKYKSLITNAEKPVDKLAEVNVKETAEQLLNRSEIVRNAVEQEQVLLVKAIYDLESGKVNLIED
jgi:carbonic anhydrase